MANLRSYIRLTDNLRVILDAKTKEYTELLEHAIREEAKSKIIEDKGGLTGSIYSVINEGSDKYAGVVVVDVPYAKYVNDGRGPIKPTGWYGGNGKVISNWNTSARNEHTPFIAREAGPFAGHHFVEVALAKVRRYISGR